MHGNPCDMYRDREPILTNNSGDSRPRFTHIRSMKVRSLYAALIYKLWRFASHVEYALLKHGHKIGALRRWR